MGIVAVMPAASTASKWRDIKVFNNTAYVVSEARGHGMQVFDLTRLRGRTSPATQADEADFVLEDFGSAHNIVINIETGRAYAVGARNQQGTHTTPSASSTAVQTKFIPARRFVLHTMRTPC